MITTKFSVLKNILNIILNNADKKLIFLFIFFSIFHSFAEIFSIGILFPLIDILIDSNRFLENDRFFFVIELFNLNEQNYKNFFLLSFSLAIFVAYLSKILTLTLISKITHDVGYNLSNKIFTRTIYKDYSYHVENNTSKFLGNIEKVENTRGAGLAVLDLIKSIILVMFISTFMIAIEPKIVISLFVFLSLIYLFIIKNFKSKLTFYGELSADLINKRYKSLQESTSNLKDIIIRNIFTSLISNFEKILLNLRNIRFKSDLINLIPQQTILLVVTLILVLLIFIFSNSEKGLTHHVSLLAGIIVGIQRMLPNFQNFFSTWVTIKLTYPSVEDIIDIINSKQSTAESYYGERFNKEIYFEKKLSLENLDFSYNNKKKILDNVSIEFRKGFSYGIIGDSGMGKSTLIDLIIGLLKPKNGRIIADNSEITNSNLGSWQKKISYVPQEPIMLDTTIKENIIFNYVAEKNVDNKIGKVSKIAEAKEFIEKLDNKLNSLIGERGSKISGGQKQRISICRALYKDFDVLILDESTNAIDYEIEDKIYENLLSEYKDKLIIIISHRRSIYKKLDHLIEIKNGKIEFVK